MKYLFLLGYSFFIIYTVGRANAETTNVSVSASVAKPISVYISKNLEFGTVIIPRSSGKVVIGSDGTLSLKGSIYAIPTGEISEAVLIVKGEPSSTVSISHPPFTYLSNGLSTVKVNHFKNNSSNGSVILEGGSARVSIGATLQVLSGETPGYYTGTFNVIFDY